MRTNNKDIIIRYHLEDDIHMIITIKYPEDKLETVAREMRINIANSDIDILEPPSIIGMKSEIGRQYGLED
jgi:hypothetical protein